VIDSLRTAIQGKACQRPRVRSVRSGAAKCSSGPRSRHLARSFARPWPKPGSWPYGPAALGLERHVIDAAVLSVGPDLGDPESSRAPSHVAIQSAQRRSVRLMDGRSCM